MSQKRSHPLTDEEAVLMIQKAAKKYSKAITLKIAQRRKDWKPNYKLNYLALPMYSTILLATSAVYDNIPAFNFFVMVMIVHLKNTMDLDSIINLLKALVPDVVYYKDVMKVNHDDLKKFDARGIPLKRPKGSVGLPLAGLYDVLLSNLPDDMRSLIYNLKVILTGEDYGDVRREFEAKLLAEKLKFERDVLLGFDKRIIIKPPVQTWETQCGVCNHACGRGTMDTHRAIHANCHFINANQDVLVTFGLNTNEHGLYRCPFECGHVAKSSTDMRKHVNACKSNPYFIDNVDTPRAVAVKWGGVVGFNQAKSLVEASDCIIVTSDGIAMTLAMWVAAKHTQNDKLFAKCNKHHTIFLTPSLHNMKANKRRANTNCSGCNPQNIPLSARYTETCQLFLTKGFTMTTTTETFAEMACAGFKPELQCNECQYQFRSGTDVTNIQVGKSPLCPGCDSAPLCMRPPSRIIDALKLVNLELVNGIPTGIHNTLPLSVRCIKHDELCNTTYDNAVNHNGRCCHQCQREYAGEIFMEEFVKTKLVDKINNHPKMVTAILMAESLVLHSVLAGPRGLGGGVTKFDIHLTFNIADITYHVVVEVDGEHHFINVPHRDPCFKVALHDRKKEEYFLRKYDNALLVRVERKAFDPNKPDSPRTVSAINFIVDEIVNRIFATDNYVKFHGINESNIYGSAFAYGSIHNMTHDEFMNVWERECK